MTKRLSGETEMRTYAATLIDRLIGEHVGIPLVLGLTGELGAGKTTFVRAVAAHLGVAHSVPSPTFLIKREYELPEAAEDKQRLVHIDAYRVNGADELRDIDTVKDVGRTDTITLIEWADRVGSLLPESAHTLLFLVIDDTTREVVEEK